MQPEMQRCVQGWCSVGDDGRGSVHVSGGDARAAQERREEQWRGDQVERAHGEALEEDCTRRCRGVCRTAWSTRDGAGSVHWSRRGTLDKVHLFPDFFMERLGAQGVVQNACF